MHKIMAFSQSAHKSQIPINCHLCDIEKNIKWKCLECELLLCDNCKIKRHPRIKNSNDHRVIDIKDVGLHGEELDFTSIKCRDHPGQTCCLFCKSCNSLVCPTCVSKVHKKHDLIEISEAYNTKKDNLKRGQRKIEMGKSEVFTKKRLLERLKNGENVKYTRVMGDIKNQGEALKQFVDKHVEKIRNEVDQDRKTVSQSIDAELHTISRSIQTSDDKNNEIEDLINNTDSAKFFYEVGKIENSMDVPSPKIKSTYKSIPDFVLGKINQSNIGLLQSKVTPLELIVSIQINKQYQTEHSEVSNISACSDNSILINCSLDEKFMKVKPEGKF
ncbi:E3 ubiquitin-protein ligase TRIM45-like [Mytilus trossulus]|uniref:E3 ubiquitin-protein ligase TRIM45-like n=1 Tax=Mytilus trossulus TaxID=6551 RepID=UPI003006862A